MNASHEKIAKHNMFSIGKFGIFMMLLALMVQSTFSCVTSVFGAEGEELMLTGSADSSWPMFRGDARNTGLSSYDTGHNDGTELWRFETGDSVYGSPVVGADGTVYFLSEDSYLYALDPHGTEVWRFETGGGETSAPVMGEHISSNFKSSGVTGGGIGFSPALGADGTIYVGVGHTLHILEPDGSEMGTFQIDGTFCSSPTLGPDGTIYVTAYKSAMGLDTDVFLYAIEPDGTERWRLVRRRSPFGGWGYPSPAIDPDGTIYFAVEETLYAIDPDGTERWSFHIGMVSSSPAIGTDGTVYISTHRTHWDPGAYFYAIEPDGTERWRFESDDHIFLSPAMGPDGTIYFGEGMPIISDRDNYNMYALNPDGTERWRFPVEGPVVSSPAVGGDGAVYFGSYDHGIYAVDPDGSEIWSFTTEDNVTSSPAICKKGVVYIGSWDNNLYALGSSTFPVPEKEFIPENLELLVGPTEGKPPLEVTITVRGDNIGLLNGSLDVMVDDEVIFTLTIPAEGSAVDSFTHTFQEPGTHTVSFHNISETVIVTEPDEAETTAIEDYFTLLLLIGIIVIVTLLVLFRKRRSGTPPQDMEEWGAEGDIHTEDDTDL